MSSVTAETVAPVASERKSPLVSMFEHARYVLGENKVTAFAFGLLIVILVAAIFGPFVVPYDPLASNTQSALSPPSAAHWFGTDQLGRDIFSRVVAATRLDFTIALAMGIVAALGNSVTNIVIATAIINFPLYARVARAEANVRREAGFVQAARLSGNSDWRLLMTQILPNIMPIMVVQMSLTMGYAILNAAGLSFIGLGVRPPDAEWGIMVAEGAAFMVSGEWWIAFFPGAALMVAVFCFNLLGDGLRDIVDPRRRT